MTRRSDAPPWVQGLRAQLKSTVGPAYRLGEQSGKAKLDVRYADGTRGTAVLPFLWVPGQARHIQEVVERVAQQLAMGLTLRQALEVIRGKAVPPPERGIAPVGLELLAAWEAFGVYKVHRTGQIKDSTWLVDYGKSAKRLQVVADKAVDAKSLLTLAGEAWPPGSRRRQVVLQHLAAMCRWGVENDLLQADRWTPPPSLKSYVGEQRAGRVDGVPLNDDQILGLLNGLPQDTAGQRWNYAFQLMSAYGLRPVELLHLRMEPAGGLWCDYIKRSGGGSTRPRQLRALHPEWEVEWRLRERIEAGEALPPFGGGVADAARRYLSRQQAWIDLATSGATCYGFRHGYALRAHQAYGLSARVAAALMGHSVETHSRHYGRWTDEATIDSAMEAAMRYRKLTQLADSG
jgi:integrase